MESNELTGPNPQRANNGSSRSTAVQRVIREHLRRRADGVSTDTAQLVAAHPELMPELGAELRKLAVIERGRRDADATAASLATPLADSLPGYEILRPIHRGGQGDVYEAIQKSTKRRVAIKVLREEPCFGPRDLSRFEREVQILGALHHPNIVAVHDSGTVAGQFYHVMDYVAGKPLDVFMSCHRPSVDETLRLFHRIGEAVHAAHLRGVIHRDLKPSNIRIDDEGEPRVLDFGLAKITDTGGPGWASVGTMTVSGQFVGSLPWASPEQVEGKHHGIDLRTDIYSLGVILYQMLTGRFPYPVVGSVREVMDHILKSEPSPPGTLRPEVNDEVDTIVLKCLSKEPARRYQSAADLCRDVERYLAGEPIEAKRDSTWYVLRKTIRRHRLAAALLTAFTILVSGVAVAMSVLYRRADQEAEQNKRLVACLEDLFTTPLDAGSQQLTVEGLLHDNAERVAERLSDQPALQARLLEHVANVLWQVGSDEAAIPWYERVLALHRDVLRSDDRTLTYQLRRLSGTFSAVGDWSAAQRCFEEALSRLRRIVDGPDPDLVELLLLDVNLRHFQGDNAGAKQSALQALDMARTLHEGDHPLTEQALRTLSWLTHDMAEFDLSEKYHHEWVAMTKRLRPNDPLNAHRHELGLLYKDMGRFAEAEPLLLAVHEVSRHSPGPSRDGLETTASLAKFYADVGEYTKAEMYCRKALEQRIDVWGRDHIYSARAMTLLARILNGQGRHAEAETWARQAVEVRDKRLPPLNWERAKSRSILGAALAGQGKFEEAEPLLLESLPIIQNDRGVSHRRTTEALERIVFLYERWGKPEETQSWRRELKDTASPIWKPALLVERFRE